MTNETEVEIEQKFKAYLKSRGMNGSPQRFDVLRVFLRTTGPLSGMELLYPVKQENIQASLGTVLDILKLMVACGIAQEIKPTGPGSRATRFVHGEVAVCKYPRHVCKDCGAEIMASELRQNG